MPLIRFVGLVKTMLTQQAYYSVDNYMNDKY